MKEILSNDKSNFINIKEIIPSVIVDLKYYNKDNFTGKKVDGYEREIAYVTKECSQKLKEIIEELEKENYTLKIYDAYRPKKAVECFIKWAKEKETKDLLKKGYISEKSSHTRGSTVDITLYDLKENQELDMGSKFDVFGPKSHYNYEKLTEKQKANRKYLRKIMTKHGFVPLDIEWWHFTLKDEPYPNTYFTFEIK